MHFWRVFVGQGDFLGIHRVASELSSHSLPSLRLATPALRSILSAVRQTPPGRADIRPILPLLSSFSLSPIP